MIDFQWYEKPLEARFFDPYNWALKFQESQKTPKSAFRECECHPHTLPKVGLWQFHLFNLYTRELNFNLSDLTLWLHQFCFKRTNVHPNHWTSCSQRGSLKLFFACPLTFKFFFHPCTYPNGPTTHHLPHSCALHITQLPTYPTHPSYLSTPSIFKKTNCFPTWPSSLSQGEKVVEGIINIET